MIFYEVLLSRGAEFESGRVSLDRHVFIIKYRDERPEKYKDYESVFKGDPYETMKYLNTNQDAYGLTLPRPPQPERGFFGRLLERIGF